MFSKRQLVIGLLVPLLVFQVACDKKQAAVKPKLPGPAQAPTLTQTLPYEIQPEPLPEAPAETAKVEEPPEQKPKSKPHKSSGRRLRRIHRIRKLRLRQLRQHHQHLRRLLQLKPRRRASSAAKPCRRSSRSGYRSGREQPGGSSRSESTTQLLDTTENQLKRVDATGLSSDQQAMLAQIKTYISQSRKAITDGDYERASNLAKKAQVLTDELMKK